MSDLPALNVRFALFDLGHMSDLGALVCTSMSDLSGSKLSLGPPPRPLPTSRLHPPDRTHAPPRQGLACLPRPALPFLALPCLTPASRLPSSRALLSPAPAFLTRVGDFCPCPGPALPCPGPCHALSPPVGPRRLRPCHRPYPRRASPGVGPDTPLRSSPHETPTLPALSAMSACPVALPISRGGDPEPPPGGCPERRHALSCPHPRPR